MKRLFVILGCFCQFALNAQTVTDITPAYFVGGNDPSAVDSFNRYVLSILPDYHPISMDSSGTKKWAFSYRNADGDKLDIVYDIIQIGANAETKTKGWPILENISITGHYLPMLKLYNGFAKANSSEADMRKIGGTHGALKYKGRYGQTYSYTFQSAGGTPAGYWWLFFRQKWD